MNELLDGERIDLAIELGGAVTLAQTLQYSGRRPY